MILAQVEALALEVALFVQNGAFAVGLLWCINDIDALKLFIINIFGLTLLLNLWLVLGISLLSSLGIAVLIKVIILWLVVIIEFLSGVELVVA